MVRTEEQLRKAISIAEDAREHSSNDWADYFEEEGDRPSFETKVCGVTLNCSECQEFDSFIKGIRYAIGDEGDD